MEDRYTQRKKVRLLSPAREDVFNEQREEENGHRSYAEIMHQ
jgi:hypothetical protein